MWGGQGSKCALTNGKLSRRTWLTPHASRLMPLPDLDDLIAEADRACDAAHRPGGQEQPDWFALLAVAANLAGQLQALAEDLVEGMSSTAGCTEARGRILGRRSV